MGSDLAEDLAIMKSDYENTKDDLIKKIIITKTDETLRKIQEFIKSFQWKLGKILYIKTRYMGNIESIYNIIYLHILCVYIHTFYMQYEISG